MQDVRKRVLDGSLSRRGKRGQDRNIFSLVREHHYSLLNSKNPSGKDNLFEKIKTNFKRWWGIPQFERATNFEPPLEPGEDFTSSASASRKRSCLDDMGLRGE